MADKITGTARRRLLYLATSMNIGGTETNLFRLIEHFITEYDVTVAVLKETGYYGGVLSENGINVVRLPGFLAVLSYLNENKFDILHTSLYRANVIGRVAGRMAGVPVVISSRQAMDKWRSPWQVALDRLTDGLAHHIICNSKACLSALVKEGYPAQRASVIYTGIDPLVFNMAESKSAARTALGLPENEPVALMISRLHAEKGFDFMPLIASMMPKGIFVIAGDGPLKEPVSAELKKLGLYDRFRFLGWRQDIARLMRASDLMLMPSREESFPQAALEAAGCGLPVVGFDIGGMKELIDDGQSGFLVSHMNFQAFADCANKLVSDLPTAKRMGLLAYERSKTFTLKNMTAKTGELYASLLGEKTTT